MDKRREIGREGVREGGGMENRKVYRKTLREGRREEGLGSEGQRG